MKEGKSKYAILGMLSIEPMSGYDIKKEVEKSISNFWTESYGQIYPVLSNLIAEKLVTKTVESEAGKPDRHVYSLTARGRKELRRWLLKGFAPKIQRDEFLLKPAAVGCGEPSLIDVYLDGDRYAGERAGIVSA